MKSKLSKMPVYLHIGGPKCGSSSLQRYFALRFSGEDRTLPYRYAAIDSQGRIVHGKKLVTAVLKSDQGFISSATFPRDGAVVSQRITNAMEAVGPFASPILSNEGWAAAFDQSMASGLADLGTSINVVFVTRPPVEWMNSSWWQWGAWTSASLENWVRGRTRAVDFYSQFQKWRSFSAVNEIHCFDISHGLINMIDNILKVPSEERFSSMIANEATNHDLLRHLINNKVKYGRDVHKPAIEFKLNKLLDLPKKRPPFVISPKLASEIIDATRENNERLLEIFEQQGFQVTDDLRRRYTDPAYYADVAYTPVESAMAPAENDEFIGYLIDRILQDPA